MSSPDRNLKRRLIDGAKLVRDKTTVWARAAAERSVELARRWKLRDRLVRLLPQDLARSMPKTWDPRALLEWLRIALTRLKAERYGIALTIFFCAFFLADLTALLVERFIPEPPPARVSSASGSRIHRGTSIEEFSPIFARNLFNSAGRIPGDEPSNTGRPGTVDMNSAPVKTTLPFNLVGTMILRDEIRSLATIEDKSSSNVYPVRVEDEIPGKARILKIEAMRVIFLNLGAGRREYVELPEDPAVSNPRIALGGPGGTQVSGGGGGVEKLSPTQFNVSRVEVDKALKDLNSVLTEARAVPNFENGLPAGYKLFQIVPGSIYDKLGLQNGDTIAGLNGSPINDPGKAFEMLNELKSTSHLELQIKREGKVSNFVYDIR